MLIVFKSPATHGRIQDYEISLYGYQDHEHLYGYRDRGHAEDCWTGCFCWIGENWPFPMEEVCKIQILEEHLIKWQNRGSNFTRINITTLFT